MNQDFADFVKKRHSNTKEKNDVHRSYAEFYEQQEKKRREQLERDVELTRNKSAMPSAPKSNSSSLPAPFKAANEMYGTVATEMNRFGKALRPMIDEAERERTTQNVTSDSEMTPERWAAMGADSSARMGLNPEATSSSPNTEINHIQIDNLSNPSSINIAFNEENEFTSPTNQYITPIENQSVGYRIVNAIEKNAERRVDSREKQLEEQEKEIMRIMPQPQPINELPVLLPETQKKTHENTAFATQVINESRAESWNEYEALDDTAKADLRIAADGIDAEKMTSGFTGLYVATFGGEEYGKALQRVTDGNEARQRLIDRGYNPNQVDNWIEFTRTNVNYEYTKSLQEDFAEMGKKAPVATTLASIGLWGATLPLDVISTADDTFDGTINEPNFIDTAVQTDEMAQQGVTEGIAEHTKLGAWLYNTGMSGVKSGIASVLPGGAFVLGVDAATNAMRNYSSKGLSSNEALVGGLAAGVFEYVFERISIGNFDVLKDANPVSLKNVTMNIAKSMGVNASEEAATELANIVYDTIINDGLSDYDILVKEYRAKGMSDEEAQAKALEDLSLRVLEAGASGLVMGAGFGTVGSTVGYVSNYAPVSNVGKKAMDSGSVDVILDAAKLAPKGTRPQQAYEHVTKKQNKGKNLTAHDIGHVAVVTQEYIRENAPELNGVFKSAKTSEDVDALYNAERYRLDQMPVTPRSSIKALDADYKAAKSAIENYNTSGARAMLDGSLRNKTYSDADTVKTRKPTIGKTEAGEIVSVSSIESIEDGNITVKTSEGTTQELNIRKDIKSVDAQTLWTNAAQNFPDAESAQAFIDNYDGGSIADYTKAFKDYYHLAATGMTLSQINGHEIAPYYDLSNKAQAAAVELGQKSISYQQGVVDLTARPKTKAQQLQVNMLDSIGKHIGMNVVVVDTMSKHDGFYRPGTNQIVVALDSSSGAILRTAGHETYHFVKEEMSDRAKDIETFVLDTLKKNKGEKWVNDRLKFYEKQGYKSKEAQTDELVADSLFDVFTSKRAVKDFATENQSLAKKLVNHIQKLLADIKNIINKLVASGKYDEIKAWQDDVASLEKLNNMFLDALDELAAKKADNPTKTKNADDIISIGEFKFSTKVSFEEQVNDALDGKLNRRNALFVSETPELLQKIGMKQLPMLYTQKHLRDAMKPKSDKNSPHHGLTKEQILKMPDIIKNPAIIMDSMSQENSVVVVSDVLDDDKAPIIMSIVANGTGIYELKNVKSNFISSYYGKDNGFESFIERALETDNILYLSKEKSQSLYQQTGLQLPGGFNKLGYDKIIHQSNNIVNNDSMQKSDKIFSTKREQLDIINETNPAPNSYNTWIRTVDDIKTLPETLEDSDWDYEEFNPDLTRNDIQKAIRNGRITVYSSKPIENGVFVSPSRMEAESYSGNGKIYEKTVDIKDVAWIDPTQGQFAKVEENKDDIRYSSKRTVASGKKKSYNKSSYYNEFDSLAMRWRNKADTNIDDCKIISRGEDDFSLLKATEDGYIELARGKYKDVRVEYERAYEEAINEIYGNYESYGTDEGRDVWDMQPSENGRDGFGYSEEVSGRELQANASRSDEHSGKSGREEFVNYSTKRDTAISEEASNYILDTKEYREVLGILERRFNTLGKVKLSPKAIDRYAGRLLQKSNSNYSREQLTERLTALFDFIANSREVTWEEVTGIAANIAKDMLTESQTLDRSMQQEYADVLKLMRESRVYISPEVRAEINHNFGSLEAFRRRLGSKLKITVTDESAVPLDVFWRELAENRPEMFEEDTNYLDMPSKLVDFFEMTSPQYINPYNIEMDMDEAAYDLALQIYDEYFNIPEVKTEAQKYAAKLEILRGRYNAKIKEIHNNYKERVKEIRTELKAENKNQIAVTKELYRRRNENYRNKQKETRDKQRLRAQIYRSAQNLTDKLVNPTDQKHIPQELISSVNEFAKAITESGVFTPDRAKRLKKAFKAIGENGTDADANLSTMYNEEFAEMFEELQDTIAGRRLTELNSSELETVRDTIKYVAHVVSMSNRAFSDGIKERLGVLQNDALEEFSKQNPDRKRIRFELQKGLLKPVTFFELIESPTMMKLYQNIRQGEGKWYNTIASAKKRRQDAADKFNYKSWKKDTITIKPERFGGNVVLSIDEALSIYATANRQQGVDHLLLGGIVREEDAKKKLDRNKKTESVDVSSDNIPLTIKDISEITSKLTKEQRGYADNLVEYMSTDMASLGNEVSMRLFGIKKFNEQKYFPLKSAINFQFSKPAVESDARIKHMSMTKPTTPKANNPVVIGDFTETVMNHCNDMALYYAFCLPLEDFNRVYNFKTQPTMFERPTSIKQKIDRAFGTKANGYIQQLLTDINGGVTQPAGAGFVNKMISLAKKNAVFGSLSVAVQQPSAVARAFLYVDPKYFVQSTFSKRDWNELKTYAPVAGVKEMGYFDTNIGRQAVDWMSEDGYDNLKEKAFALFKDKDYRDDKLSFLPSYMDQISWGHIWNAVKKETAHNNPDMDKKSEEFLKLAGERFTYVIDRTQVYDSVFARSEWMRSKDTGVKVVTAFMSEPLTNYNMLYSATVKARHGDKKFAAKAVSAYIVSVAFNSILKSLVTAGRDDDEDKSYWEKYLSDVVANFIDEPFGMIPYLKDFASMMQGYDSNRMDTQVLADLVKTVQTVSDSDKTPYEKVKSVFGTFGIALGVPFKNLWRDSEMVVRTVEKIFKGEFEPTTKKGVTYAIKEELGFDAPEKYEQLIDAYLEGDDAHYNKVNNNLKAEKSESAISEGIKKAVKNKYQAGTITEGQATDVLQELLGYDDNKAYWTIDEWGSEDEDYAKYNDFSEAVRTGDDLKDVINDYLDHGVEKKTLAGQITKTFKAEYTELYRKDKAEASALRRRLLDAYVALGYDRDDKADDIADWLE